MHRHFIGQNPVENFHLKDEKVFLRKPKNYNVYSFQLYEDLSSSAMVHYSTHNSNLPKEDSIISMAFQMECYRLPL